LDPEDIGVVYVIVVLAGSVPPVDVARENLPGRTTRFAAVGEHVLVLGAAGLPPLEAEIVAHNFHRPHLVQVAFAPAATPEWIFRSRIADPAGSLRG
jgi:hypothetical protein